MRWRAPHLRSEGSGICLTNKYKNRKVITAEGVFDSVREYHRYLELRLLERAGKITELDRQVRYELIPAQHETYERYSRKTGKRLKDGMRCIEKSCVYVADFVYRDAGGSLVAEDAKGCRTEVYIIKRKLMLHKHGIRVREV